MPPPAPGGYAQAAQPTARVYAGFWQRVGAAILDGLILGVPALIAFIALVLTLPREDRQLCTDFDGNLATCEPLTDASVAILLLAGLGFVAFVVFYWFGSLVGKTGLTPGRRALGIKVVDMATLQPIGFGRGVGRYLMTAVFGIVPFLPLLDVLWVAWDDDKQSLHDKVVRSVVIEQR